jgi:hypothetical protein
VVAAVVGEGAAAVPVRRLGWIILFLVLALLLFVIVGVALGWGSSLWPILGAAGVLLVVSYLLLRESKREQSDFLQAQSMEGGATEPSEGENLINPLPNAAAPNERRR